MQQSKLIELKPLPSPEPAPNQLDIFGDEEFPIDPSKPFYSFFVFVNPTSGGNKAAVLTKLNVEKFIFSSFLPSGHDAELSIYSLKDGTGREKGLKILKRKLLHPHINARVIVGGGDGTVMWVVQEMINAHISFDKCPIGIIPFGTGNDFSRVLGWGGHEPSVLIGPHLNNLKTLVKMWSESTTSDFDIWEITVEVYEEGGICRIHKETGKKFQRKFLTTKDPITGEEREATSLTKKMCNYYSFGIDARIGFGFDKSRTTSRHMNKMVYCWEGFKKHFVNTFKVNTLLQKVHTHRSHDVDPEKSQQSPREMPLEVVSTKDFLLFPSNSADEKPQHATVIRGNPGVFLCLNIPSYMGGASNPWAASKGKIGVTDPSKQSVRDFDDQDFGDGKIEMISFGGPTSLALERFFHGQGRRIGQAGGPINFNFKRNGKGQKPLATYMQIDGEYFQLLAPKSILITHAKDIPNGKIKVLVNTKKK